MSMESIFGITAVILAGGLGTRLRPVVSDRPKIMADVAGRPFLAYLLEQIASAGIRNAVICTGYMAGRIRDCFGDTFGPLKITYSREYEPLGTGGALRLALPFLASDTVLVANGDSYVDADLNVFADWFAEKDRQAAILLTRVGDTSRYGRVRLNEDKSIASFEEKCENPHPGWINAGVYLIKKAAISLVPAGQFYSLERSFFDSLIGKGLFGFCTEAKFVDIGTPESYAIAESFFSEARTSSSAGGVM